MKFTQPGLLLVIYALGAQTAVAQSTTGSIIQYQTEAEQRVRKLTQEYRDKKSGASTAAKANIGFGGALTPDAAPLSSFGAQWKIRSVRYTCANGVSVSTRQQTTNADFAAAVIERRDTAPLPGKRAQTQTELDALDDLDTDLKKLKPLTISFKFKKYDLLPERGALGWHYVNRANGISWGQRQGKGILKNTFSGRIIAHDCRAGSPFVTDAPESTDEDLSAFAKRP